MDLWFYVVLEYVFEVFEFLEDDFVGDQFYSVGVGFYDCNNLVYIVRYRLTIDSNLIGIELMLSEILINISLLFQTQLDHLPLDDVLVIRLLRWLSPSRIHHQHLFTYKDVTILYRTGK